MILCYKQSNGYWLAELGEAVSLGRTAESAIDQVRAIRWEAPALIFTHGARPE